MTAASSTTTPLLLLLFFAVHTSIHDNATALAQQPIYVYYSDYPSLVPSDAPSNAPSDAPSNTPSDAPSSTPSDTPSVAPSDVPSILTVGTESDSSIINVDPVEEPAEPTSDGDLTEVVEEGASEGGDPVEEPSTSNGNLTEVAEAGTTEGDNLVEEPAETTSDSDSTEVGDEGTTEGDVEPVINVDPVENEEEDAGDSEWGNVVSGGNGVVPVQVNPIDTAGGTGRNRKLRGE